jgi:hypothetical protein
MRIISTSYRRAHASGRAAVKTKKMYIRAFVQHHIDLLRTVFGYWFGIGARMYFPGRHSKEREGRSVTMDILLNIIAENHSRVVQRFDESGINGLSFQYDPETWDIMIRVMYLSVTVKYAKENVLVPPCIWDTGDNNVRGMLSEVGTLFLYDYDYCKTLEEYTGQDMLMVGIQEDMFDEEEGAHIPMQNNILFGCKHHCKYHKERVQQHGVTKKNNAYAFYLIYNINKNMKESM